MFYSNSKVKHRMKRIIAIKIEESLLRRSIIEINKHASICYPSARNFSGNFCYNRWSVSVADCGVSDLFWFTVVLLGLISVWETLQGPDTSLCLKGSFLESETT